MADVFVSYSRRDLDLAWRLAQALRDLGKSVFIDVGERLHQPPAPDPGHDDDERTRAEIRGIPPSAPWLEEIRDAIAAADTVLVLVSPDSCASPVCQAELGYAAELNKRLIPVMVRDTPPDQLPAVLARLQWTGLSDEDFAADVRRIGDALDTDIEGLRLHTRLTVRAREWDPASRSTARLLRGPELSEAERWLAAQAARRPAPTPAQTAFIMASRQAASRRQRGMIAVSLAIALAMAALTAFAGLQWHAAVVQRQRALAQRDLADSRALAAGSGSSLETDPQLALLLALRAYAAAPTAQAKGAVRAATAASTVRGYLPAPAGGRNGSSNANSTDAFSPDGRYVAVTGPGRVEVWRWQARHGPGSAARPYVLHPATAPGGAQFSPDGRSVLFTGGGRVYRWDWRRSRAAAVAGSGFRDPVLAPDGQHLASGGGRTVAITALAGTGPRTVIRLPGSLGTPYGSQELPVVFSPDSDYLAVLTQPGPVLSVYSTATGGRVGGGRLPAGAALPMAVNPDDTSVAVSAGGAVDVFQVGDLSRPTAVHTIASPPGLPAHCCDVDVPTSVAWNPAGTALAVGTADPWVRVWLGSRPAPIYLKDTGPTAGAGVSFSPDSGYLLTSGGASQVWAWAAATTLHLNGAGGFVLAAAASPDGHTLALATQDNRILLWDWRSQQVFTLTTTAAAGLATATATRPAAAAVMLAFRPHSHELVSVGNDNYVRVWDLTTTRETSAARLPAPATGLALSRDGSQLAVAYGGGVVRWPAHGTSSPVLERLPAGSTGAQILSVSPAGAMQLLVMPGPRGPAASELTRWDGAAGAPLIREARVPDPATDENATLLPNGQLALCSQVCWQYAVTARPVRQLAHAQLARYGAVSLSGDRRLLFAGSLTGRVSAWDLNPADPPVPVTTVQVAAPQVLAGPVTGRVLVYSMDSSFAPELIPAAQDGGFAGVLRLARSHVVRQLTPAERKRYLGQ